MPRTAQVHFTRLIFDLTKTYTLISHHILLYYFLIIGGGRRDDLRASGGAPPRRHSFGEGRVGHGKGKKCNWTSETRSHLNLVKTNCFRLDFVDNGTHEWFEYQVKMYPLRRTRKPDPDNPGEFLKDNGGEYIREYVVKTTSDGLPKTIPCEKSNTKSRRIMKEFKIAYSNIRCVTDGSDKLYSPVKLPETKYLVTIPKECDTDDPDAKYMQPQRIQVELLLVHAVQFSVVNKVMEQIGEYPKVNDAVNIALRDGMLQKLKAYRKAPRDFFFAMDHQTNTNIVGKVIGRQQPDNVPLKPKYAMSVKASAFVTQSDGLLFTANLVSAFTINCVCACDVSI